MKYQFRSWIREKIREITEKIGNLKLTGHPVQVCIWAAPSGKGRRKIDTRAHLKRSATVRAQ